MITDKYIILLSRPITLLVTGNTPFVYCLSLGWRVCREEYTDALGFLPCDGFGSLVYVVRDAFGQQMGYSQISKEDAFEDAYKKSRRLV
jgi:hypothetical protein